MFSAKFPRFLLTLPGPSMTFDLCCKNGEIVPMSAATMPVTSIEVAYGFGVYEHVRVVRRLPFFLREHLERLWHSAHIIGLRHRFNTTDVTAWMQTLIARCAADAFNVKILLYGGHDDDATLFVIPLAPRFVDRSLEKKGASVITVDYERLLPQAKTLSMLGSYLAYRQAREAGAYDALLVDRRGCVTEGTRTNLLAFRGRTILTAPHEHILQGVTLTHVLAVAKHHGFAVEEADLRPTDLVVCDGVCLTSTSTKVLPLSQINDDIIAIPDALRELAEHFRHYLSDIERSMTA